MIDWRYLEKMDRNLLYEYAQTLSGDRQRMALPEDKEQMMFDAYYIIYFVYKYILSCDTLSEVYRYTDISTIKAYHIDKFASRIYVGYGINSIHLGYGNITTILEILYNRYSFFEQMECLYRNTSNARSRVLYRQKINNLKKEVAKIYEKSNIRNINSDCHSNWLAD